MSYEDIENFIQLMICLIEPKNITKENPKKELLFTLKVVYIIIQNINNEETTIESQEKI